MIAIELLREQPDVVKEALKKRCRDAAVVDEFLNTDNEWRTLTQKVDDLRAQQKAFAEARDIENAKLNKENLKLIEEKLKEITVKRKALWTDIPNIPQYDVPVGPNESGNQVIKTVGDVPAFNFSIVDYLTLATKHDLIDLERAAKVSGSRFAYLKNEAALLSMALVRYGTELAVKNGFTPIIPPVLISEESMSGMGYLENGGVDETYHFEKDGLFLVGTSEQSIGPMHAKETFSESSLPKRYVSFSSCFRREAGSYGKDTKGIIRVHQFDKLEMFIISHPDKSNDEHELLLSLAEQFMQGLKLPYHVLKQCTGDMGAPSSKTYDIEVWIPSENKYRETHSCSNTTDYQSRRLDIKYTSAEGNKYVHMLNGTMVAVNRPLVAILENYQLADGTIAIPEVLQNFVGKKVIG